MAQVEKKRVALATRVALYLRQRPIRVLRIRTGDRTGTGVGWTWDALCRGSRERWICLG